MNFQQKSWIFAFTLLLSIVPVLVKANDNSNSCYEDNYQVDIYQKLDIVIVADTSPSIHEQRARVANNIDKLLADLPAGTDYQIGVILAHSKWSRFSGTFYKGRKTPRVLKSSEHSITEIKAHLKTKLEHPPVDIFSDGGEMGLASFNRSITEKLNKNRRKGFYRGDAALMVLFISDENDICAVEPEGVEFVPDPQGLERLAFKKECIEKRQGPFHFGGFFKYLLFGKKYKNFVAQNNEEPERLVSPEIVYQNLLQLQDGRPVIAGAIVYNEDSEIPEPVRSRRFWRKYLTSEKEIGYGYLEFINLHEKNLNIDFALNDYEPGLSSLSSLVSMSLDPDPVFALRADHVDPTTIEARVNDVAASFEFLRSSNELRLTERFSVSSAVKLNYCEDEDAPVLAEFEDVLTSEDTFSLSVETEDVNPFVTKVVLNGAEAVSSAQSSFEVTLDLIEGENQVEINSRDEAGNESASEFVIIKDSQAPEISANVASVLTNNPSLSFSISITDAGITDTRVFFNGAQVTASNDSSFAVNLNLNEGENAVRITSEDEAGNAAEELLVSGIVLDTLKPVLSINALDGIKTNQASFELIGSVTDQSSVSTQVFLNDNLITTKQGASFSQSIALVEGSNIIKAIAIDGAGNASGEQSFTVIKDSAAPEIIASLDPVITNNPALSLPITVNDSNLESVKVFLGNSLIVETSESSISASINLIEGENTIKIEATDMAGNSSVPVIFGGVVLDTTLPVLSFANAVNAATTESSFTLSGSILDANDVTTEIFVEGSLLASTTDKNINQIINLVEGDNLIRITATDVAGNFANAIEFTLVRDSTAPQIDTNIAALLTNNTDYSFNLNIIDASDVSTTVSVNGVELPIINGKNEVVTVNLVEGTNAIDIIAVDALGNTSSTSYNGLVLDNTLPVLSLNFEDNIRTNMPNYQITGVVTDDSSVSVQFFLNGTLAAETSSLDINEIITLAEGNNTIEVIAVDGAGNTAEPVLINNIFLDTSVPGFISLIPDGSAPLDSLMFDVVGTSSEILKAVIINGVRTEINSDTFSIATSYPQDGSYVLEVIGIDQAENSFTENISIEIVTRILNPSLVFVEPSQDATKLVIRGAAGAAKPGIKIDIEIGFFQTFTTFASADGSFSAEFNGFSEADIIATDEISGVSEETSVSFIVDTALSGIVKDTNDNPLPGVTVTITGTGKTVQTDGQGIFSIPNAPTGDQTLVFDGSTIPPEIIGTERKFFSSSVSVSVGQNQSNVIETPIYLAALMLDGSETNITASTGGTVTSANAPGMALRIPAGVTSFPDGQDQGAINFGIVQKERVSVSPPDFADPDEVFCLEPSGLTFSEPVELTLPNVNEFPAGLPVAILSMNSQNGFWEVDGFAKVTEDGQSIITEPGQGITHFSLVYASPLAPDVKPFGGQDRPGADTFNGSVSTSITMPSYKVLGSDVAPGLVYRSSWAKPTTVVTNIFDVPRNTLKFNESGSARGLVQKVEVNEEALVWVQPDRIDAQFISGDIVGEKISFTGVPQRSVISYAMDLSARDSGIFPYSSSYEVYLKKMVLRTRTIREKRLFRSTRVIRQNLGIQAFNIEQVFPSQIGGPLYVQNRTNSEVGTGWKISAAQKIVNPGAPRIMLEEADGSISAYSLDDSIESIVDSSGPEGINGVNFSTWPNIEIVTVKPFQAGFQKYLSLDASLNSNPSDLTTHPLQLRNTFGSRIPEVQAAISGGVQSCSYIVRAQPNPTPRDIGNILTLPNGRTIASGAAGVIAELDKTAPWDTNFAGFLEPMKVFQTRFFEDDVFEVTDYCQCNFGRECGLLLAGSGGNGFTPFTITYPSIYANESELVDFCAQEYLNFGLPIAGNRIKKSYVDGSLADARFNTLKDMVLDNTDTVYIADMGNNRVRAMNLISGQVTTYAGNGQTFDMGDGGDKLQASIFHPKGLAVDAGGNLYIASENGLIRRIDKSSGIITLFAGKTLENGGQLFDRGDAREMYLNGPSDIIIDRTNDLMYVSDTGNHRVMKIDLNTLQANTVVGNGQCADIPGDGGPALNASLCNPTQLGLDDQNNLLILDYGHDLVRRVVFGSSDFGKIRYASVAADNSSLERLVDGTWVRSFRNGTKVFFDISGKQTSTIDRIGREISFDYDTQGRVIVQTDPVGKEIIYSYSGDKLDSITDPQGRTTSFDFDGTLLSQVNFPDGTSIGYEYDENGLLISETNQRNFTTSYEYNEWNRVTKITRADNSEIKINDAISATVGNNFVGGSSGQLQSFGAPGASNVIFDEIVDGRNISTEFIKSEDAFISTIIDAEGKEFLIKRNEFGDPLEITRPDGSAVTFVYDNETRDLISKTDSLTGVTTSQVYDQYGNLLSAVDAKGLTSSSTYDPSNGLLLTSTNTLGQTSSFTYDARGLVETRTNSIGRVTNLTYDGDGNLATQTNPLSQTTTFLRDDTGSITEVLNAESQLVKREYDVFNRLTAVVSAKNERTEYTYLPTGELETIKDPFGNITSFEYDQLGRVTKKTDPNGFETLLSYDENGNVIQEIDPNGNVKNFEYDDLDRIVKRTLPDNVYEFAYDINGNTTQVKNNISQLDFDYVRNESGFLVAAVRSMGLGVKAGYPEFELEFDYNSTGQRVQMESPFGTTSYSYDDGDRLESLTNHKSEVFEFDYDANNRLVELRRPGSTTTHSFDDNNILESIVHSKGATQLAFGSYLRDDIGNVAGITSELGTFNYGYDDNNQVTNATNPELPAESFAYDELGNRTSDNGGSFSYDPVKQRLVEDYNYFYTFDNNGNLTSKQEKGLGGAVTNYIYNSENQLIGIDEYDGATLIKEVDYFYDALNRRVEKIVQDLQDGTKSFTRRYTYDGSEMTGEYDGSNNVLSIYTHSTLRTDDVLSVDVTETGAIAGRAVASGSYFYLKDALGTITDLTNQAGSKVQHYVYSAFGKLVGVKDGSGSDIAANPVVSPHFTFTGREYDSESGLHYYRARYYDPSVGRFLQVDPDKGKAGIPTTFTSKYVYSLNDPINRFDPLGRISLKGALGIALSITNPSLGLAFVNTDFGRNTLGFSKRDVDRINKVAIIFSAVALNVASGGSLTPVLTGVAAGGLATAALSPEGQFFDNFLSGASVAAVTGAVFQFAGTTSGSVVPVSNIRDIITILTISQDPNVQNSLEGFFGKNDGDPFPGLEF